MSGLISNFNSGVLIRLHRAGWSATRDMPDIEKEDMSSLGESWLPQAGSFVRSFGHLDIDNKLFVYPAPNQLYLASRLEDVISCKACPLAESHVFGESTIWTDSNNRYYLADDEGMMFLGNDTNRTCRQNNECL